MTSREQILTWAREHVEALHLDMAFKQSYDFGGFWDIVDESKKGLLIARAASGLAFLRTHAGADSEWARQGLNAYESKGGNSSLAAGVRTLGDIIELWVGQVESGVARLPAEMTAGVRAVASTDVMEQVRTLNEDGKVHPAAPIVLAGAALETALRAAVEELELVLVGTPGLSAYGNALRTADIISKQDVKDVQQMAGLRNAAAHGNFDELSSERAGLMEQQVNYFLRRLEDLVSNSD